MTPKEIAVQKIKDKLSEFYGVLRDEHKCITSNRCRKFITRHLHYYRRPEGYRPKKILQKVLDDCGLKFLGSGASRFVVGYDKFAIKVEKWNSDFDGRLADDFDGEPPANKCELKAYRYLSKDPLRKVLIVPLYAHFTMQDRLVLVYPQLDSYDAICDDPAQAHVWDNPFNKIKESACNWLFADGCVANFGLYKNELFFLDYNIEDEKPYDYGQDYAFKKDFDKAIEDLKMCTNELHRTRQYIKEMKAI
jgi:hypothetical protein